MVCPDLFLVVSCKNKQALLVYQGSGLKGASEDLKDKVKEGKSIYPSEYEGKNELKNQATFIDLKILERLCKRLLWLFSLRLLTYPLRFELYRFRLLAAARTPPEKRRVAYNEVRANKPLEHRPPVLLQVK